jgi:hypothetical protein
VNDTMTMAAPAARHYPSPGFTHAASAALSFDLKDMTHPSCSLSGRMSVGL